MPIVPSHSKIELTMEAWTRPLSYVPLIARVHKPSYFPLSGLLIPLLQTTSLYIFTL